MMILNENQTCVYGDSCPYANEGKCQGLNPSRNYVFTCNFVNKGEFIKDGYARNPLDVTGKMKILTET